ncbi:hypothetical protein [Rhodococcus sp. 1139]|uniref:hypothetical protein n=1 Tax=Rhodococcus sp. 1139 TaxID=1833762 RepID=UPI00114CC478|nr:hypothetical protein [Rhodococcus sp. 1139]
MTVLEEIVMSGAGLLSIVLLSTLVTVAIVLLIDWLAEAQLQRASARRERADIRRELATIRRAERETVARIMTAYEVALSEVHEEGGRAS